MHRPSSPHSHLVNILLLGASLAFLPLVLVAQQPAPSELTLAAIFEENEFESKSFAGKWLPDRPVYAAKEDSPDIDGGQDIVVHDPETGDTETLVTASQLIPPGQSLLQSTGLRLATTSDASCCTPIPNGSGARRLEVTTGSSIAPLVNSGASAEMPRRLA